MRPLGVALAGAVLVLARPTMAAAQYEANIETLAAVMAADDARRFDEALFRRALADPDSSVRRRAALGLGRLRDPAGLPLLKPLLLDPDSLVEATTIFAMGLLGDPAAVPLLIDRAQNPAPLSLPSGQELLTALARLGGEQAAGFIAAVLDHSFWASRPDAPYLVQRGAIEAWRLGALAPINSLLGLTTDQLDDTRFGAIYSLGRLRARVAGPALLGALADASPTVRSAAVRGLSRSFADSAGLAHGSVADALLRASRDGDVGVRTQALRALATYHDPELAAKVAPLLDDPAPNVQVQAAMTLGELGGGAAGAELARVVGTGKGGYARLRESLLALARVDTSAFEAQVGPWSGASDWRRRATAAAGWAWVRPSAVSPYLADRDPRVVAAALEAWSQRVTGPDTAFVAACRRLATYPDAAVRSIAADGIARGASAADAPPVVASYQASSLDSFPDARLSATAALLAIAKAAPDGLAAASNRLLAQLPDPPPGDYIVRRWAEQNWPEAATRWGAAYPIVTRRSMDDYRDIVRRFDYGVDSVRSPTVAIDVEQVGTIVVQLFGPEAPLTVANFLRLVDRHFFDDQRFFRVVPDFVVQAGDPRGDGWGGPGTPIRDELNRRRYGAYYVGMALSGPDTGDSQWFITLSPAPNLDGIYTIFGQVTDGVPTLLRVTQGDVIRSIRR